MIKTATPGINYANNATFAYSSTSLVGSAVNVNVRKPVLTITKTPTPSSGMAGDTILYTVTVNNTSVNADAYDIRVTDLLPSSIFENTGSLTL